MAGRRRLTVMGAATSALLVVLSVCLLLITGGFATDGWPVLGGDDKGSALRLPDPRAPADGSADGSGADGGAVATSGTTHFGTVSGIEPSPALPLTLAEIRAPLSPFLGDPIAGLPPTAPGPRLRSPAVTGAAPPLAALLPGLPFPTALVLVSPAFPAPQPARASLPAPSARSPSGRAPQRT
ncbi:MAG: hypothetical protein M3459_10565, partial [Actinomycetota bacterium]|nr:hypothetical protein [Actinomycetota bacterium]